MSNQEKWMEFSPEKLTVPEVHRLLLFGVSPRPIALVSTVSVDGVPNLAPFSFFNAFGANPPIVAFSAARSGKDGRYKDTYQNLMATKECVIQVVTHSIVEQVNLASTEYPPEVNEFIKSGLTPIDSDRIRPKRVQESPFQMECKLKQMISLGEGKASGNLAICEVILFHVASDILTNGQIDPYRLDVVARNGGEYYTRANHEALFQLAKPSSNACVGYDSLPESIRFSSVLTGNHLGRLANVSKIPSLEEAKKWVETQTPVSATLSSFERWKRYQDYQQMFLSALYLKNHSRFMNLLELTLQVALDKQDVEFAWKIVVCYFLHRLA